MKNKEDYRRRAVSWPAEGCGQDRSKISGPEPTAGPPTARRR